MKKLAAALAVLLLSGIAAAENPLVKHIFTADPQARVFNGRLYLYTSHDLPNATYFDMVDWQLLSSDDLKTWKDHGAIFTLKGFAWATKWAWAPECVQFNGKYYLYLPVDRTKMGVAVSDSPEGPFKDALGKPLIDNAVMPEVGEEPIDPSILIDDDKQPYLFFGCRKLKVAKLDASMIRLDGPVQDVQILDAAGKPLPVAEPDKQPVLSAGYGEGPCVFKRNGKYYLLYSNGWARTSQLVYATADKPTGPYTYAGPVIEHVNGFTQHGSVAEFKGKWYLFYHTADLSGGNSYRRAVCMDEMTFDADGKIKPVVPTRSATGGLVKP